MNCVTENEKLFFKRLETYCNQVFLYEDSSLQALSLKEIPLDELRKNASQKATDSASCIDELLIKELLKWYKFKFFTWVDIPVCETCGQTTERKGYTHPVLAELLWNAGSVENYFCSHCKVDVRFPRYSHPKKLLETKRGRCGEWANCFTLLCRSLGYEARFVVEWGDHVWTEVFVGSKDRWIHCDPCENSYDTPLMYENGWKKKISYVIAFSKDDVQDVTWRYSRFHPQVLRRRTLCSEKWLLDCCTFLANQLQAPLNARRKEDLLFRKISELAQFLAVKSVTEDELSGRTSGSLSWRVLRGECNPDSCQNVVVKPNDHEIGVQKFELKFCCATDKYVRDFGSSETNKWDSLIHSQSNIFRKIEHDWNMVYLARHEGSSNGYVTWKFCFQESGLVIETIYLKLLSETFENGSVKWKLTQGIQEVNLPGVTQVVVSEFRGHSEFTLTALLSGGKGDIAWQHAQLFRQSLDSTDFPFEISIKLMKKDA